MHRRGNSFGDWFLMIVIMTALILMLINISKEGKQKQGNFQSWTMNYIDNHILKPLRKL